MKLFFFRVLFFLIEFGSILEVVLENLRQKVARLPVS
jgi:hypothetical protein